MGKLTVLWLLVAALNFARTQNNEVLAKYFTDGGELVVSPADAVGPIMNILWKFKENLVAEFIKSADVLDFYGTFKNRTQLDVNTGRLTIDNMSNADQGVYTVDINSNRQRVSYDAKLIVKLRQPKVLVTGGCSGMKPDCRSKLPQSCNVRCEAVTEQAGPVSYSWKIGDGVWKELGNKSTTVIHRDEHKLAENISCRIKNPVSESTSEPIHNPLYCPSNHIIAIIVSVVVVVVVLVASLVLGGLWYFKKGPFKKQGTNITDTGTPRSPAGKTSEDSPLKNNPSGDKEGA